MQFIVQLMQGNSAGIMVSPLFSFPHCQIPMASSAAEARNRGGILKFCKFQALSGYMSETIQSSYHRPLCSVLYTDDYKRAREKADKAQFTSNLDSGTEDSSAHHRRKR